MTSKEALEQIMEKYMFYVPARSEGKENLINCLNIVAKDLERLEKLNNIFSDSHICEIKAKFNDIECNADKCKTCSLGVGDGICLKNTFEHKWKLEEENKTLRNELHNLYGYGVGQAKKDLLEENKKLLKAIEILKDKFNLKVQILVFYDNREEYHLELQSHHTKYSFPISKDLYELLKEVLSNDTNKSEK